MWIRARRSNVPLHVRKKHKQRCSHGDVIVLEDEMEKYKKMFPNTEVRSKARISNWSQSQSHASKNQETRCDICLFGRTCKKSFPVILTTGCVLAKTDCLSVVLQIPNMKWTSYVTQTTDQCYAWIANAVQPISHHPKRPFVFSFGFAAVVAATMRRAP